MDLPTYVTKCTNNKIKNGFLLQGKYVVPNPTPLYSIQLLYSLTTWNIMRALPNNQVRNNIICVRVRSFYYIVPTIIIYRYLYSVYIKSKSMGVTGASNERFLLISIFFFFYLYIFFIPRTHTGTAIIIQL